MADACVRVRVGQAKSSRPTRVRRSSRAMRIIRHGRHNPVGLRPLANPTVTLPIGYAGLRACQYRSAPVSSAATVTQLLSKLACSAKSIIVCASR